jgi:hypothetical protein
MSVSLLDIDLGVAAPLDRTNLASGESADSLLSVGMEAWVEDAQGGWPAYLLSRESPESGDEQGGERLRWLGPGDVGETLTMRFAHGLSLYEWETHAVPVGGLTFETPYPQGVTRCRARCEERLRAPRGMTLRLADGSERRVVDVSVRGLRFGLNMLMDEVREGDVVPALLFSAGRPALSVRVDVQHVSELGDDGPVTAGGTLELVHPQAQRVWSELVASVQGDTRA